MPDARIEDAAGAFSVTRFLRGRTATCLPRLDLYPVTASDFPASLASPARLCVPMKNFLKSATCGRAGARARIRMQGAGDATGARACFSSLIPDQNSGHRPTPRKIVPVQASVGRDYHCGRRTLQDYEYRLRDLRVSSRPSREYCTTNALTGKRRSLGPVSADGFLAKGAKRLG